MNKWCNSNNSMESFLLEYQQLLPFMMSPAATATNLFIPSLFGTSPAAGPFMISSTAATTAANVIPPQYRKLFIGGLNHETTDDQLRDYYSKWGNVVDCIVIRDPVSRCSRGFGFVTFAMPEMADIAMAERPHTIGGKIVDPKRAIPREQMLQAVNYPPAFLDVESPSECKLFLSGIHWDFHTVDALRHYFEQFGEVQQVEIIGHPRGYGFVAFDERVSVLKCLEHSRSHVINGKKIDVRENDSSDGRLPLCSPPLHIAVATTRNGGGHHLRSQQNMEHYNYRKQYGSAGGHHGQGSTGSMGSQGSQTHSPVESVPGSPK